MNKPELTIEFIEKRIREQEEYLKKLHLQNLNEFMNPMRYRERHESATVVLWRFRTLKQEYHEYWSAEMEKCKADPVYFFGNYVTINGKKPTTLQVKRFRDLMALMPIQISDPREIMDYMNFSKSYLLIPENPDNDAKTNDQPA